jgi:hypothetical protein
LYIFGLKKDDLEQNWSLVRFLKFRPFPVPKNSNKFCVKSINPVSTYLLKKFNYHSCSKLLLSSKRKNNYFRDEQKFWWKEDKTILWYLFNGIPLFIIYDFQRKW